MIKLLKYELIRRKKLYVITLCIFAVLTLLITIGIPRLDNAYWILITGASAIVLLVGAALLPLIINTAKYYGDYKNRNGYMMFLTPSSGSKIFGSKILAAVIDTLGVFILVGLCGFVSYLIADAHYALEPHISGFLAQIHQQFPEFSIGTIIGVFILTVAVQILSGIVLALFSITVSKTLLSQKPLNWFIPLLIFLGLSWAEQFIMVVIVAAQNFSSLIEMFSNNNMTLNLSLVLIVVMGLRILFMAAYTVIASTLISKKLDL